MNKFEDAMQSSSSANDDDGLVNTSIDARFGKKKCKYSSFSAAVVGKRIFQTDLEEPVFLYNFNFKKEKTENIY